MSIKYTQNQFEVSWDGTRLGLGVGLKVELWVGVGAGIEQYWG